MSDNPNALRTIKRPELVTIGTKAVSVNGWHYCTAADHLSAHLGFPPSTRWCNPGCMASTMLGRDSKSNREKVRGRISKAFHYLLSRGLFLAIEYAERPHRTITAFKILVPTEELESQYALAQVARMRQRRELNEEKYLKALALIGCSRVAASEESA